ncbi:MAG: hypothetical protein M1819_000686 [Sarea resinae]|nr:MAG: hypothetical protein M1819_000686 [Sarea resinae]
MPRIKQTARKGRKTSGLSSAQPIPILLENTRPQDGNFQPSPSTQNGDSTPSRITLSEDSQIGSPKLGKRDPKRDHAELMTGTFTSATENATPKKPNLKIKASHNLALNSTPESLTLNKSSSSNVPDLDDLTQIQMKPRSLGLAHSTPTKVPSTVRKAVAPSTPIHRTQPTAGIKRLPRNGNFTHQEDEQRSLTEMVNESIDIPSVKPHIDSRNASILPTRGKEGGATASFTGTLSTHHDLPSESDTISEVAPALDEGHQAAQRQTPQTLSRRPLLGGTTPTPISRTVQNAPRRSSLNHHVVAVAGQDNATARAVNQDRKATSSLLVPLGPPPLPSLARQRQHEQGVNHINPLYRCEVPKRRPRPFNNGVIPDVRGRITAEIRSILTTDGHISEPLRRRAAVLHCISHILSLDNREDVPQPLDSTSSAAPTAPNARIPTIGDTNYAASVPNTFPEPMIPNDVYRKVSATLILARLNFVHSKKFCDWCLTEQTWGLPGRGILLIDTNVPRSAASKMCHGCAYRRMHIISHEKHVTFLPISVHAAGPESLSQAGRPMTDIMRNRQTSCCICPGYALSKCLGCPLIVCASCECVLPVGFGGDLDHYLESFGPTEMRNDARLLYGGVGSGRSQARTDGATDAPTPAADAIGHVHDSNA